MPNFMPTRINRRLIASLESVEFDAQMSIFSGFNSFLRALSENSTVIQLKQFLADTPVENQLIWARLILLLAENIDSQYAHPKDVAIAAYLYALTLSKEFPQLATEKVLRTPNLMWAKKLAEILLANQTVPSQP